MLKRFNVKLLLVILASLLMTACSTPVPSSPKNLCKIFQENGDWYDDVQEVYAKRGVPINVVMAFIYHESGYVDDAKPPMRWFLFIPYGRGSSAYGYPQAQDPVWEEYLAEHGGFFTSRDDFKDSVDFVSWYMLKTRRINKIPLTNVYLQYINYHDGWGGYKKGLYKRNKKLRTIARNVEKTARNYATQLRRCDL